MSMSAAILSKFAEWKEPKERYHRKLFLWTCLYKTLREVFPDCNLVPFGSTITGLATGRADLDLVLILDPAGSVNSRRPVGSSRMKLDQSDKVQALSACNAEIERLQDSPFVFERLVDATVPLLVLRDRKSGEQGFHPIEIELSVSDGRTSTDGTRNTRLLAIYSKIDQRVAPLVVIVKKWAAFHVLTGPRYKRLSGYSWALMVIFYLQRCGRLPCLQRENPSHFNHYVPAVRHLAYDLDAIDELKNKYSNEDFDEGTTLGAHLRGFFHYYSHFEFGTDVVSIRTGQQWSRDDCAAYSEKCASDGDLRQWYRECLVEDPFYRYNVARATSNRDTWLRIHETIKETNRRLKNGNKFSSIFFSD